MEVTDDVPEESQVELVEEPEEEANPFGVLREDSATEPMSGEKCETQQDTDSGIEAMESEETTKSPNDYKVDEVRQLFIRVFGVSLSLDDKDLNVPEVLSAILELDFNCVNNPASLSNFSSSVMMNLTLFLLNRPHSQSSITGGIESQSNSPSSDYNLSFIQSLIERRGDDLDQQSQSRVFPPLARFDSSRAFQLFTYLLVCYVRAKAEESFTNVPLLRGAVKELVNQIFNHLVLLLSGTFDGSHIGDYKRLLVQALSQQGFPKGFWQEFVSYVLCDYAAEHVEKFDGVFRPLLDGILRAAQLSSLGSNAFHQPLVMLKDLCQFRLSDKRRPFCDMLVRQSDFLPASLSEASGREISKLSILGIFLSLSVLLEDDAKVGRKYFGDTDISDDTARLCFSSMRHILTTVRSEVHQVVHELLTNSSTREAAMTYIAAVIQRNAKKAQMMSSDADLASDGFMLNFLSVMYLLSVKVILDKVNPAYPFSKRFRLDVKEEAKLKLKPDEYEKFLESQAFDEDVNFHTECFFLTLHAQHISLLPMCRKQRDRGREIAEIDRHIATLERTEPQWAALPIAPRNRHNIAIAKSAKAKLSRSKLCGDIVLKDEILLSRALQFCEKVLMMLANLISPHGTVVSSISPRFGALPEFYLEDILDFLLFLLKQVPTLLNDSCSSQLAPALMLFLCTPNCFNKPFLSSKLVEVIYCTFQPQTANLSRTMLNLPMATDGLFRSLVTFYSDCEHTGSHTEFYDKFNIRFQIQIIFKHMWNITLHRSLMIQQCNECGQEFIRFINMLINDTTFLLDESLEGLRRIHGIQELMASPEWYTLSEEDKKQKESRLNQDESTVKSYMQISRETLDLFHYLTKDVQAPFLSAQLGHRLAAMLNYNLHQLIGEKSRSLKVKNADKYNFEPKVLLNQLTDIYLHLDSQRFHECLAADERSYDHNLFQYAIGTMERLSIKPQHQIEQFRLLSDAVFRIWKEKVGTEEDLGDVPDEFQDPIMGSLMKDPVALPSGHIMDRSVILQHLFNDRTNPFNRTPLDEAQLVDQPEVKAKIERWVKEKKEAKRNQH